MAETTVALSATTQAWRAQLHEHIRDHVFAMTAVTVRDQRQIRGDQRQGRGRRRFDVVVIDDVMRIFTAADVGAAQDRGTRFIGLYDLAQGRGQPYLVDLGVDVILPATTPIAELIAAIRQQSSPEDVGDQPPAFPPIAEYRARPRRGTLTAVSRACGGVGSTETTIALADHLSGHRRVLVIEADELGPSAGERLGRDPDCGLARALGRVAHGHKALPDGLSPPARDSRPRGAFDIICGTSVPGGPPVMNPQEMVLLVEEALEIYDEVFVETTVLIAGTSDAGRDRFAAARAVLARADRIVVLSRPDGEGAVRLVNWVSAAVTAAVAAPIWAGFGRSPRSRYQRASLDETLASCLPTDTFQGVHYLPEDSAVTKAKWNGELVRRGRWLAAVQLLAGDLASWAPAATLPRGADRRSSRLTGPAQVGPRR